jgi:hypothetical protein
MFTLHTQIHTEKKLENSLVIILLNHLKNIRITSKFKIKYLKSLFQNIITLETNYDSFYA